MIPLWEGLGLASIVPFVFVVIGQALERIEDDEWERGVFAGTLIIALILWACTILAWAIQSF